MRNIIRRRGNPIIVDSLSLEDTEANRLSNQGLTNRKGKRIKVGMVSLMSWVLMAVLVGFCNYFAFRQGYGADAIHTVAQDMRQDIVESSAGSASVHFPRQDFPQNREDGAEVCVITISAWNNFGFVGALYDSIVDNSPKSSRCFAWFVSDAPVSTHAKAQEMIDKIKNRVGKQFTIVTVTDLVEAFGTKADLFGLFFKHDKVEMQQILKPIAFQYAFEKLGACAAIYVDHEIWVTGSLDEVHETLRARLACFTPHILPQILKGGMKPAEFDTLNTGVFNFGFVGFKNSPQIKDFVQFWYESLRLYGKLDLERFICLFFDSKDYVVLKDPSYTNECGVPHEREPSLYMSKNGLPKLGESEAKIVHFSGMSLLEEFDTKTISNYQTRNNHCRLVMEAYMINLKRNGLFTFRSIPYGFNNFSDETFIDPAIRQAYAAVASKNLTLNADGSTEVMYYEDVYFEEESNLKIYAHDLYVFLNSVNHHNPFCVSTSCMVEMEDKREVMTFRDWYIQYQRRYIMFNEGAFFYSAYEDALWKSRPDVQKVYPDPTGNDFVGFKEWVLNTGRKLKKNTPSEVHFNNWLMLLKHHLTHHTTYHKKISKIDDVGVNIIGWHGGLYSIGMIADKVTAASKIALIPTRLIQLHPCCEKRFIHPQSLILTPTRSPLEIVNLVAANADYNHQLKVQVPPLVWRNKYNIGYWAWELEKFPDDWAHDLKDFDEIWCLSSFIKESIQAHPIYDRYKIPIKVLHLALSPVTSLVEQHDVSLPFQISNHKDENGNAPFTFLIVFDFRSFTTRKNPEAAIRAFLDAFPTDSLGQRLIVKSHSGTPKEVEDLKKIARHDPRIIFINQLLSDDENAALHSMQDCYVSLHRGEGYALNILESMAAGKPVIATNYSGNVDLFEAMDTVPDILETCIFPVQYKLIDTKENDYYFAAGNRWAEPDHEHAVKAMRMAADRKCTKRLSQVMSKQTYTRFSEAAIGERMKELLSESFPLILRKQQNNFTKIEDLVPPNF